MSQEKAVATTNEVAKASEVALTPVREAQLMVMKYATAMLDKVQAQRFATQVAIMSSKEPKIGQATPESLGMAMMACVHLNLMPNTPEQYAYIIPYDNRRDGVMEVQFQLGYKGLIELGYRSGEITSISAEAVFPGDTFRVSKGTRRELIHEPSLEGDDTDPKKVTHVYAVLQLRNGEQLFKVMSRAQVEAIQKRSKVNSEKGPWATDWIPMALKTVLKQAYKLAPTSGEDNRLAYAAQADSLAEAGRLRIDPATGEILEAQVVDDSSNTRKERMAAADAKYKELKGAKFTPKPVEAQ